MGKNAGKLGVFGFQTIRHNSYKIENVNSSFFEGYEIWDLIGQKGLKSIVLFDPISYPPRKINGYMVSGALTPSIHHHFTYPEELRNEILSLCEYKIRPNPLITHRHVDEYMDEQINLLRIHMRVVKYMIGSKEWHFLFLVLRETDDIQHYYWKYIDKNHPAYVSKNARKCRDKIEAYWTEIDVGLDEILDTLNNDAVVMLISDHGFGRLKKRFCTNDFLIRRDFLRIKKKRRLSLFLSQLGLDEDTLSGCVRRLKLERVLERALSFEKMASVRKIVPPAKGLTDMENVEVDWRNTAGFSIGKINTGMIFINDKERPHGIIEPRDRIRARITEELRKTAKRLNMRIDVHTPEQLFYGEKLKDAPDILFVLNEFEVGMDPHIGHDSLLVSDESFSGIHRMNGIFIASGPEIKENEKIEAEIVDIAPTILHIMGVAIPDDMDGKVLRNMFKENSNLFKKKVTYQRVRRRESKRVQMSDEDREAIMERLRQLGYL